MTVDFSTWQHGNLVKFAEDAMEKMTALSTQVGGDHYKNFRIQPMEFILANGLSFAEGNAIKYIVRKKGDATKRAEDLRKAIHNLQIQAEHEGLTL